MGEHVPSLSGGRYRDSPALRCLPVCLHLEKSKTSKHLTQECILSFTMAISNTGFCTSFKWDTLII